MTAVISPPDSIVSQPEQTRTFFAYREELVLVMKTEYPVRGPSGEQVDLSEGIRLQFQAGMLRVPLTGHVTSQQGRKVPAKDVTEFLDATSSTATASRGSPSSRRPRRPSQRTN
jgi:hypothetical protein